MLSRPSGAAALAIVSLSLGSCGVQGRPLQRFAGTLTSPDPLCPPTKATLIANGADAVFTPAEATWTLSGKIANGILETTRSRPGVEHRPYVTVLTARLTDVLVSGTYRTPTCTYVVGLASY